MGSYEQVRAETWCWIWHCPTGEVLLRRTVLSFLSRRQFDRRRATGYHAAQPTVSQHVGLVLGALPSRATGALLYVLLQQSAIFPFLFWVRV